MKKYYVIIGVVALVFCFTTVSFAAGYEKFFGDSATKIPAGWSKGEKKGWDGQKLPPGLSKGDNSVSKIDHVRLVVPVPPADEPVKKVLPHDEVIVYPDPEGPVEEPKGPIVLPHPIDPNTPVEYVEFPHPVDPNTPVRKDFPHPVDPNTSLIGPVNYNQLIQGPANPNEPVKGETLDLGNDLNLTSSNPDPLDVTGDGKVDMTDVEAFKGKIGSKAGDANWDPKLDLNGDGVITVTGDVIRYRGRIAADPNPDPLDVTGDGKVDMADVEAFRGKIGSKAGDENWDPKLDLNGDGVITAVGDVLMYRGRVNPL